MCPSYKTAITDTLTARLTLSLGSDQYKIKCQFNPDSKHFSLLVKLKCPNFATFGLSVAKVHWYAMSMRSRSSSRTSY